MATGTGSLHCIMGPHYTSLGSRASFTEVFIGKASQSLFYVDAGKRFWYMYFTYGPPREKTCLPGFANNTCADQTFTSAQTDQHLCYSLFGKYHYVNLLQVKFQVSS